MQTASRINVETILCRQCGAENSGERGFCSSCGDALWMKCPECEVQVAVSETYCGGCGCQLADWLENKKLQAQAAIAKSRAHLEAQEFDLALEGLSKLTADDALPKPLQEEAKSLLKSIRQGKTSAEEVTRQLVEQADRYLEQNEYRKAIESLEQILPMLLTPEIEALLSTARVHDDQVAALNARIDAAFAGKVSIDVMRDADQLLAFQPDHEKAWRLGEKLRAQVLKLATAHFEKDEPERAIQLLDKIPARFVTDAHVDMRQKVSEYHWLNQDIRLATHVDRTLVECAHRIQKQFPQQQQINQLLPELSKRFADATKDPLRRMKTWAKPEAKPHLGCPLTYLRFDNCLDGFEKLAEFNTPYATTFATAIGLALGGLEQAEFQLSLEPRKKKKFSLSNLNVSIGGSKKKPFSIGIDLGHAAIRAVRLSWEKGDRPKIEQAVQIEFESATRHLDDHARRMEIVTALRKLKEKLDFSKQTVVVSMPLVDAFFRVCPLPQMEKKQMQQAIIFEARHQIPFPFESVAWNHHLLSQRDRQSLLLFACKGEAVEQLALPFEMAGIEFAQIQAAPIALLNLWNLVRAQMEKEDPAAAQLPTALLDVGHSFSTLILRGKDDISLRILGVAGDGFTRRLVQGFNLTYEQAERLKNAPYESPQISRVFEHLQPGFELLEAEINKTLAVLSRDNQSLKPAVMYCSGGGSLLHGLMRSLRNGADSMKV